MDKKLPLALKVNDLDNVATVFSNEALGGTDVEVRDKKGASSVLRLLGDIPYGHKVALRAIHAGEDIIKYGESLGEATHEIAAGEYVHVHNLDSKRGRGDKEG
ncbi:MAG: UxaA family hydrolase [Oscillospiraceae bacterium]|nr:UxaA family hydrolase [Oscillospiraceae bacterium]